MNRNESKDEASTYLGLLRSVLGVRIENALLWSLFTFACTWFLSEVFSTGSLDFDRGPIGWLVSNLENLGINPPNWLSQMSHWLRASEHSTLLQFLIVLSVACGSLTASGTSSAGLPLVATLGVLLAIEGARSLAPAVWYFIGCLLILAIALARARLLNKRFLSGGSRYFPGDLILEKFIEGPASILWIPIALPVLVMLGLVNAYLRSEDFDPGLELGTYAYQKLAQSPVTLKEADAAVVLAALVAPKLAGVTDPNQRWLASMLLHSLKNCGPSGAAPNPTFSSRRE